MDSLVPVRLPSGVYPVGFRAKTAKKPKGI